MKHICIHIFMSLSIMMLVGVVWVNTNGLPLGEMAGQWLWLGKACVMFAICILIILLLQFKDKNIMDVFYRVVVWTIIFFGGGEAIYGLWQVYGDACANYSFFTITGSFFNPGPYSGYLSMIFPLCLNEWLQLRKKENHSCLERVIFYFVSGIMLLIICVLPAAMSRSAWLAAIFSGLWVCYMQCSWKIKMVRAWRLQRIKVVAIIFVVFIGLIIGGFTIFNFKKDSANGRFFMWKISCLAIKEHPLVGYGIDNFAYAYGESQEKYFAKEEYSSREEFIAGSPKCAFNEYLQFIVECGFVCFLIALVFILFCLWRGIRGGRISACGGIVSLLVFSFFSYPMKFPAFVIVFFLLLGTSVIGRSRIALAVFVFFIGLMGIELIKRDTVNECKRWADVKNIYNANAYQLAKKGYYELYPLLKNRGTFLFEYGYCLHKLKEYDFSTVILKEAETRNCDPMILNIIGKNFQQQKNYTEAERYFIRSVHRLPHRLYPYYLLAKLYEECGLHDKKKKMAMIVLTKAPKVQSVAVREMRIEMSKIINN